MTSGVGSALVVELGVAAPDVVAALAFPVSAVAPAAHRHHHPVALPAALAHARVDAAPAPVLGDLPAGVARLLDLPAIIATALVPALERGPVLAGSVGALALPLVPVPPAVHVYDDRAVAAAVAHLEPDLAPAAVLGQVAARLLGPVDRPLAVLVVERRVAVAEVVGAAMLALVAAAPPAHVHHHPAAVLVAVAHLLTDVAPAAALADLPAGVARLLDLAVADAVGGRGRRDAGEAGHTQAQDGAEGETGAEGRWHRSPPRSDGRVNAARRGRFLARTAKLRTRLTVRRETAVERALCQVPAGDRDHGRCWRRFSPVLTILPCQGVRPHVAPRHRGRAGRQGHPRPAWRRVDAPGGDAPHGGRPGHSRIAPGSAYAPFLRPSPFSRRGTIEKGGDGPFTAPPPPRA